MRRKEVIKKYLLTLCLGVSLVTSQLSICYGAQAEKAAVQNEAAETGAASENTEIEEDEDAGQDENYVEIRNTVDFLEFVENCKYDSWSLGRTVSLAVDLNLGGMDFDGIAYFNGVFEGNGHTVSFVDIVAKGSDYGFFRYIGENGEVKDLNVVGVVAPSGSQENIGGIAGVNYGTIAGCSFHGTVKGGNSVGAIVGRNKETGTIDSCVSEALVLATNYTGGITGTNAGIIRQCLSKSSVNTEELEPTLDLGGVDVGSFNFAQNVVNRNDLGGIAGISSGVIADCENEGIIGYKHTGYNVGGIAGSQNGMILTSTNKGKVYGRKDVGGIVGQAEPYVESEYLDDKVQQTKDDINRLSRTLNNISATMSSTSQQVKRQAEKLNQQYTDSIENISGNLDSLNAAAQGNPEAQQYVDQINASVDNIKSIQSTGGELSQEQKDVIQDNLNKINDNLNSLHGTSDFTGQSPEEFTNYITNQLGGGQTNDRYKEIQEMADTIDAGVQSVANNMKSASNQIENITNSVSNDLSVLVGDEELVEDISSVVTAENMDGVISGCVNYGEIHSDLNAGGIAGTINIEYGNDPEFDLRLRNDKEVNVRLRSTVNGVVIHSINYGMVTVKKDCAGGIAGLQELGFIYDCEGYGPVQSETGSYLGGIVGDSAGTIEKGYSLCNLSGMDYVGGICGNGYAVKESISVSGIESDGERIGSIAGHLENEGTVEGNIFVSDDIHGVDNISYAGVADKSTYEEVMAMEGIPEGFSRVTIRFETEDGELSEKQIAYGGSLTPADFPEVPEKEGCYVEWPGLESLVDIRENLTVTAEYVPWMESVAGTEKLEEGKSIFLAVGAFYEDTEVLMEKTDGPKELDDKAVLAYAYSWKLNGIREKQFDTIEAHLLIPEGAERTFVWVRNDGTWTEVPAELDGSYLVAELPYGADFAVVTRPAESNMALIITAVVVVLLVGAYLLRRRRKAAGKKK